MADRPAKDYSTQFLLQQKGIAERAIEGARAKMNGTGGWIAREANQEVIDQAQNDINIIEAELALR
jgi:hypothetical protein